MLVGVVTGALAFPTALAHAELNDPEYNCLKRQWLVDSAPILLYATAAASHRWRMHNCTPLLQLVDSCTLELALMSTDSTHCLATLNAVISMSE